MKRVEIWTAPGKDELHSYWIKQLTSIHARLAQQMNHHMHTRTIKYWLTTGRTVLLMNS